VIAEMESIFMNDKIGQIEARYGIPELLVIMKGIENIIPIIP
jgi:hypothetical protein